MPSPLSIRANVLRRPISISITRTDLKPSPLSQIRYASPTFSLPSRQQFSNTPFLLKKKGRADREEAASSQSEEVEDPFDFSSLETGIEKVLDKLKNDLSKLRTGGRFNPEVLESLRVHLVKDSKNSEKLGDLAQVLPKGGRSLMILVGEKDHVKPIVSAIQASKDLNLQPVQDSQNATQLNVPIPPPTKESRDQALSAASKTGETANAGIRTARGAMQKRLRAMEIKKAVRPDDLKKASKDMEKIVEKGVADVKKTVDAARKGMEQS
ncbi:related to RRF1 Mitochondrial ribosome recycling factor [Rhynchosporium secalis]|uniref:Related to RRF1 Mitochondrial ribosome recycling factor n=1 Tax=Rhynchosporium secalis TaxID=38038 RepID=A0A1E1MCV3_RHYSE|nr:related to RRF1 Mitochondrial ribosome recycling factor [Rhynchosporium secalis]